MAIVCSNIGGIMYVSVCVFVCVCGVSVLARPSPPHMWNSLREWNSKLAVV